MSEITIQGHQIDLSEGRHVFVAEREDRFLVEFKNAKGEETRLGISKDAAEALHHLLSYRITDEQKILRFFVQTAAATTKTKEPHFEWREVNPDTLPAR